MKIRCLYFLALLLALGFSAGCHEDDDDDNGTAASSLYTGRFSDDPVQGVFYEVLVSNEVMRRGRTDELGRFRYPRDRAGTAVFFLGSDELGSDERLELGRSAISESEASTEGLTLTPADLSGNIATVLQIASFLQGLDSGDGADRLIITDNLHSRIIASDALEVITDGPYVAGTSLLNDFADLPAEGNEYPALADAIARLQAAQRCHAAGVYRYSSDSGSGTFALPASLPVDSVYGLSDDGLDIRGAFRSGTLPTDTDLSFREINAEEDTSRAWAGRFARDYRSIDRTSDEGGPTEVLRLSDTPLTDLRWRMVSTATNSVLLEMNFHEDGSISGVRADLTTAPSGNSISGSYTGGDDLSELELTTGTRDSSGTYSITISGLEATVEWTPTTGGGRTSFTADLCRP